MSKKTASLTAASLAIAMGITASGFVAPEAAEAAGAGARYKIGKTRHADSGFVGARKVGKTPAFRVDPRARRGGKKYRYSETTGDFRGAKGASVTSTRRAAWILSEYGKTRDRTTAAAVDVAVFSLLRGKKWRVKAKYTRKRTNKTGHGATVRRYARAILSESTRHSGPYRVVLSADRTPTGSQATVRVRVTNYRGLTVRPKSWAGIPVTVTYAGQPAQRVTTDPTGSAAAYFTAASGATKVTASATVPEDRLILMRPRRKGSRLALAGRKRTVGASTTAVGINPLTLGIKGVLSYVWVNQSPRNVVTVSGGSGVRNVTFQAYGPSSTPTVSCSGNPIWRTGYRTTASTFNSPSAWRPAKSGYYKWMVVVSDSSGTTSQCGPVMTVRKQLTLTQNRGSSLKVKKGKLFGPTGSIGGFDRNTEAVVATTSMYGPFAAKANAKCGSKYLRSRRTTRATAGSYNHVMTTQRPGWYVFRTVLSSSPLQNGTTSACSVKYQVVQ